MGTKHLRFKEVYLVERVSLCADLEGLIGAKLKLKSNVYLSGIEADF